MKTEETTWAIPYLTDDEKKEIASSKINPDRCYTLELDSEVSLVVPFDPIKYQRDGRMASAYVVISVRPGWSPVLKYADLTWKNAVDWANCVARQHWAFLETRHLIEIVRD